MSDSHAGPRTKADPRRRLREERLSWSNLLATVPDDIAAEPILPNGWPVKDIVAHIAACDRWTAAQVRAACEGREPTDMVLYGREELPSEVLNWDLDQINAAIPGQTYGQYAMHGDDLRAAAGRMA